MYPGYGNRSAWAIRGGAVPRNTGFVGSTIPWSIT
jgi:hypothetical protein